MGIGARSAATVAAHRRRRSRERRVEMALLPSLLFFQLAMAGRPSSRAKGSRPRHPPCRDPSPKQTGQLNEFAKNRRTGARGTCRHACPLAECVRIAPLSSAAPWPARRVRLGRVPDAVRRPATRSRHILSTANSPLVCLVPLIQTKNLK